MEALDALAAAEAGGGDTPRPDERAAEAAATRQPVARRLFSDAAAAAASSGSLGDAAAESVVSSGQDGATPQRKAKRARAGSSPGAIVAASGTEAEAAELVQCRGCSRVDGGPSFVSGDAACEWAFQGRGSWCKDCHTCWRTCYSNLGSMALFAVWLNDPEHELEFFGKFVAYMTLLREGSCRITKLMIETRYDSLKWAFAFVGAPLGGLKIEMLKDTAAASKYDPTSLVQVVMTDGAARVGSFLRLTPSLAAARISPDATQFIRSHPPVPRCVASLPLQSSDSGEAALVGQILNVEPTSMVGSSPSCAGSEEAGMARKVDVQALAAHRALTATFASSFWSQTAKESQFTPLLQKFATIKHTASSDGDKSVLDLCTTFIDGLTAGKGFVKLYRVWARHRKLDQLLAMHPQCNRFLAFLESLDITPHCGLTLLGHKIDYLTNTKSEQSVSKATQVFISSGGFVTLGKAMIEVWMREVFTHAVCSCLSEFDQDALHERRSVVSADIGLALEMLAADRACAPLIEDMRKFLLVLEVALGAAQKSAAQLREAIRLCTASHRMTHIKRYLESDAGAFVLAEAKSQMEQKASDDLGHSKLCRAIKLLGESDVLSVEETEMQGADKKYLLVNSGRAFDLTAVQQATESICMLFEGIELFSGPAELEENKELTNDWTGRFVMTVSAVDHCIAVAWATRTQKAIQALTDAAMDDERADARALKPQLLELQNASDQFRLMITTPDAKNLRCMVGRLLAQHGGGLSDHARESLEGLAAQMDSAAVFLPALLEMSDAISDLRSVDFAMTAATCLEEWRANRSASSPQKAFLDIALTLKRSGKVITDSRCLESSLRSFAAGGGLVALDDEAASGERVFHNWQELLDAPVKLLEIPLVKVAVTKLVGISNEVIPSLVESLGLPFIRRATTPALQQAIKLGKPASELVSQFVNAGNFTDAVRQLMSLLAERTLRGKLTSESLMEITLELVEVLGEDSFKVTDWAGFFDIPPSEDSLPSLSEIMQMLVMWTGVYRAVVYMCFFKTAASSAAACVREHSLKQDLVLSVESFSRHIRTLHRQLSESIATPADTKVSWVFPLEDAHAWVTLAQDMLLPQVKRYLVVALAKDIYTLAEKVASDTPQYSHFVSGTTYHPKLVRRHLVNYSKKEELSDNCVRLCLGMSRLGKVYCEFGLGPNIKLDDDLGEGVAFCDSSFKAGKQALTIVAAISVIETMRGAQAKDKASTLLYTRKALLPESVVGLLEKIVAGTAAADVVDDTT